MRRLHVRLWVGVAMLLTSLLNSPYLLAPAQAAGRTIEVTGSLQSAINVAQPGDVLALQPRTYSERVTIKQAGTSEAPITLQGAGRGQSIIKGRITFNTSAAHWVVQDLDVNVNRTSDDAIRLEAPTHHVVVRRVHLYNGKGYGVRIDNDVSDVLIEDSEIDHFDAGEQDAHGVGIMTARNITVRGCDIHHNSGDGVQSNTPDYAGYNRFASNILIENNKLHENRENALDVKSTHGLIARNNQMWGYKAVDTSDGMAIQVQYDAQDVMITGNQIWDAVWGIEVTRGKKNGSFYPAVPKRVTIAGNVFRDLGVSTSSASEQSSSGTSGATVTASSATTRVFLPSISHIRSSENRSSTAGFGIIIRSSADVRVYNNTVLRAGQNGVYLGASRDGDFPVKIDIRDNVMDGGVNDLAFGVDLAKVSGLIIDYNHYVTGRVHGGSLNTWLSRGYERNATNGDPQLDSNLLPSITSPLRDSGVVVGLPYQGAAPDRGWGELTATP